MAKNSYDLNGATDLKSTYCIWNIVILHSFFRFHLSIVSIRSYERIINLVRFCWITAVNSLQIAIIKLSNN